MAVITNAQLKESNKANHCRTQNWGDTVQIKFAGREELIILKTKLKRKLY